MAEQIPLMRQYAEIKARHPDEVLFFRLGDFYELFGDEAKEVSRLLNLTLTHRGDEPMCGIPHHAGKGYIARLLRMGRKIAICEQIGEPAKSGLTERRVTEVITPGTALESEYLDTFSDNFLACLFVSAKTKSAGFAYIDVTTSAFFGTEFSLSELQGQLAKELGRCAPRELLLPQSLRENPAVSAALSERGGMSVSFYPDWHFSYDENRRRLLSHFKTANLKSFSIEENSAVIPAAGFLLDYLKKTTNSDAPHVRSIRFYSDSQYVVLDSFTRRNLEITESLNGTGTQFTLFGCVNFACTAMGSRLLRSWISSPLTDLDSIIGRQESVQSFFSNPRLMENLRSALKSVLDVERLAGRIALERAHAKDLQALRSSLEAWISCAPMLEGLSLPLESLDEAKTVASLIRRAILDDPATSLTEGRIIRDGWSEELDHFRSVQSDFNRILSEYLESEREATGIQNLRIRYGRNDGYFFEVTKGKLGSVPEHFVLRRSLVNQERYTTARLHELEIELNEAGSRIVELERDLYLELRGRLQESVPYLLSLSRSIARADCAAALAFAALKNGWTRPLVEEGGAFCVRKGRHPVVEAHLPSGTFVPNDIELDSGGSKSFALITGPNMAGKSTFLRQNALIAILAQAGSFVPAESARIGIADRIFCRVGASDNLAKGESTFLVEMTETAGILRTATRNSIVIMDEVGRGTSTEDGLSIAWAVSEHLLNSLRCRTLFATHYHELTRMEHPLLKMLCMEVAEDKGSVVFLRRVIEGASANSYGIHVARLAGVPDCVIARAVEILSRIQSMAGDAESLPETAASEEEKSPSVQAGLFSKEELVICDILNADENNMTPMQALSLVARWKAELRG